MASSPSPPHRAHTRIACTSTGRPGLLQPWEGQQRRDCGIWYAVFAGRPWLAGRAQLEPARSPMHWHGTTRHGTPRHSLTVTTRHGSTRHWHGRHGYPMPRVPWLARAARLTMIHMPQLLRLAGRAGLMRAPLGRSESRCWCRASLRRLGLGQTWTRRRRVTVTTVTAHGPTSSGQGNQMRHTFSPKFS
jgi:hypothetical protein